MKTTFFTRATKNQLTKNQAHNAEGFYIGDNAKELLQEGFIEPTSKKDIYYFTPKYADYIEQELTKLDKTSGLPRKKIEEFIKGAIANNVVNGFRPVNISARDIYEKGAIGKPLSIKGKSSEGGKGGEKFDPSAGYIPYDQSISKLSSQKVPQYQEYVEKAIKANEAKKIQLITSEGSYKLKWFYKENGSGVTKDFFYKKYDQNNKLLGVFCKDLNQKEHEYIIEKIKQPLVIKPLYMLGKERGGKLHYFAPDADPLVYGFKLDTARKSQIDFVTLSDDHYKKMANIQGVSILHTKGFTTADQDAFIVSNEIDTEGATTHSADTSNPVSFYSDMVKDLAQGNVFYLPNGRVEVVKTEQDLVKLFTEYAQKGYAMFPNPRWGWKVKEGKPEYYIPTKRFNWQQLEENINNMTPEQRKQAACLRDLQLALDEHQYRQSFLGDYGDKNVASIDKDPPYVNSHNFSQAETRFKELNEKYSKEFGNLFDLNPVHKNIPLKADSLKEKAKLDYDDKLSYDVASEMMSEFVTAQRTQKKGNKFPKEIKDAIYEIASSVAKDDRMIKENKTITEYNAREVGKELGQIIQQTYAKTNNLPRGNKLPKELYVELVKIIYSTQIKAETAQQKETPKNDQLNTPRLTPKHPKKSLFQEIKDIVRKHTTKQNPETNSQRDAQTVSPVSKYKPPNQSPFKR
jgi:hypothetical protein